jgi:arginase
MLSKIFIIQNDKGQKKSGVILEREQVEELIVNHTERIEIFPKKYFENPEFGIYELSKACFSLINNHSFNIFLGGDHYTSFGTILGSLKKYGNTFKLLWIDAHADIHSWETSPSKNMHGMPLFFLMNHSFTNIPQLQPEQILYVGLRSVEVEEWNSIHKNRIKYITAKDFLEKEEESYYQMIDFLKDSYLHISLDVDGLDPSIMPSTGTSIKGGLLLTHFDHIIKKAMKYSKSFFAIDIMEYNPDIGTDEEKKRSKDTMKDIFRSLDSNICF